MYIQLVAHMKSVLTWYFRMSMLKYDAFGFCSACLFSSSFKADMWNSKTDVSLVDMVEILTNTHKKKPGTVRLTI